MVAEFTFACVASGGAAVHTGRQRGLEIVWTVREARARARL